MHEEVKSTRSIFFSPFLFFSLTPFFRELEDQVVASEAKLKLDSALHFPVFSKSDEIFLLVVWSHILHYGKKNGETFASKWEISLLKSTSKAASLIRITWCYSIIQPGLNTRGLGVAPLKINSPFWVKNFTSYELRSPTLCPKQWDKNGNVPGWPFNTFYSKVRFWSHNLTESNHMT